METFTQLIEKVPTETLMQLSGVQELKDSYRFGGGVFKKPLLASEKGYQKKIWYMVYSSATLHYASSMDYYIRRLKITALVVLGGDLEAIVRIMLGILKNAKINNVKSVEIFAQGNPLTINFIPWFYLIPAIGWIPTAESAIAILAILKDQKRDDLNLDNLFTTKVGLYFWMEFGVPLYYEFDTAQNSISVYRWDLFYIEYLNKRGPK